MIARVVELSDGTYQVQFRYFLFFWENSVFAATSDREEAIAYARLSAKPKSPKIVRKVYQ